MEEVKSVKLPSLPMMTQEKFVVEQGMLCPHCRTVITHRTHGGPMYSFQCAWCKSVWYEKHKNGLVDGYKIVRCRTEK